MRKLFNRQNKTEKTNWLGVNWLANTKLGKGLTKGFFLVTAAGIMFISCVKPKTCDAKIEDLKGAQAKETSVGNNVRAAIEPALTNPDNVGPLFWNNFNHFNNQANTVPKNLQDSTKTFVLVIDDFRKQFGNPLPSNNKTLSNLYDLCIEYDNACKNVTDAQSALTQCETTK
ncbi:MAG: hypothetical protein FWE50_02365 [Alphaproteobacteria bacterium]|nr:hypothetical protein [Alphaproteobacteria bacterium]